MQSEYYNVRSGETIYDISMRLYGSLDAIVSLVYLNPQVNSIDFDYASNPNQVIEFDAAVVPAKATGLLIKATETLTIGVLRSVARQSLYDICLMTYGKLDQIVKLLENSNVDSIDETEIQGNVFSFSLAEQQDKILYSLIQKYNYVFATNATVVISELTSRITENNIVRVTETGLIRIVE